MSFKFPMTRRRLISGAAAVLAMPAIRTQAAEAVRGGHLRIALYKDLATLSPVMGIFGNTWRTTINLYNNLTRLTANGGVEGDLAESWEPANDATVWTFKLLDGVKFHDGSALSAADVVATIEKILDPKTAAPYKGELGPIGSVKALDRLRVRIDLTEPFADLPKALASATARIISEKGVSEFDKLAVADQGTGPFILKEFQANQIAVLERNPGYFRSGRPYLDRVTMRVLPDVTGQTAALQNREVDAIAEVDTDTFKQLGTFAGIKTMQVPGGTFNNLVLYANKPPFNDPRVRMALRLAMDRRAMAEAITAGTGSPADDHPISETYEFWDRDTPIRQQNLEQARRLLKEAGHGDGFEERLVVSNSPASREKTGVLVQAMAEQIGVRFKIELMDSTRYINTVWNKGVASYIGNYATRSTEDAILTKLYSAKYGIDEGRWANPESDAMLDAARRVTDPAKRREIYVAYQRLVRDQGPFVIPNFFNSLFAVADYVNNWPARAINTELRLEDCWMSAKSP